MSSGSKETNKNEYSFMYVLISNVPLEYHTPDLRNYFSYSIEKESFICFNYRHRPHESKKFNIAICKVKPNKFDELLNLYDKKNWLNSSGILHKNKCSIIKIKSSNCASAGLLNVNDLNELLEFRNIPKWMPNGNVGTPTRIFLDYINQCIMPQSLISKLGINMKLFKKHKKKPYSNVQYNYDNKDSYDDQIEYEHIDVASTASGHKISENIDDETLIKKINYEKLDQQRKINENDDKDNQVEESDGDDDELEEWDRHEALHDDVTKQDRTSPYFFENEIELKWEKGGSGLVFYTDDNFWKEHEGKDFDAETADDLDIDMSAYNDPNGGDKDAQDMIEMRREKLRRKGIEMRDDKEKFEKNKFNPFKGDKNRSETIQSSFGKKHLEKLGWKEGEPVGNPKRSGLIHALDGSDGKIPTDKTGIGYRGPKIDKEKMIAKQKLKNLTEHRDSPFYIASKFDIDPSKPNDLYTRYDPIMKYRKPPS